MGTLRTDLERWIHAASTIVAMEDRDEQTTGCPSDQLHGEIMAFPFRGLVVDLSQAHDRLNMLLRLTDSAAVNCDAKARAEKDPRTAYLAEGKASGYRAVADSLRRILGE
jgi:hypothetical protein